MDDGIFEFGIQKVQELVAIQGLDFVENWMQDPFRNMRWCFIVWLHLTSFMYLLAWLGISWNLGIIWQNDATYIYIYIFRSLQCISMLWWLHGLGQGQWMVISHQPHQARRSWDELGLGKMMGVSVYGRILVVIKVKNALHFEHSRFGSPQWVSTVRPKRLVPHSQPPGCSAGSIRWNVLWQQSVSNGFWVSHVDLGMM